MTQQEMFNWVTMSSAIALDVIDRVRQPTVTESVIGPASVQVSSQGVRASGGAVLLILAIVVIAMTAGKR